MKAIIHKKYGLPSVAQLAEVDKPRPEKNELLVKVYSSTVNRTDAGFRSAEYFVSRFFSGLFRPRNKILGSEFSGVIEGIGEDVVGFKIGDKVFGYNDKTFGGHAEYLTIAYNAAVAIAPKNISIHEAAAITEGAHYALNIIRVAKVMPGQAVLVYGATGAIGTSAVQLLKYFGANVTAVCNTKNVTLLKNLGAKKVIDYQKSNFAEFKDTYDFIFDAVGKINFRLCKPLLNKNGIYISTEFGKHAQNVFLALKHVVLSKNKRVLFPIPPDLSQKDAIFLAELVQNSHFKPVIDSYRRLDEIVEVYTYVDSAQKTGNVILKIVD